jgi:Glutaredoxin
MFCLQSDLTCNSSLIAACSVNAATTAEVAGTGVAASALAVHSRWAAPQQRAMCSAAQAQQPSSSAHTQIRGDVLAPADIMVYQYKICPFCNKLKAVMDYLGVPYQTTEVNPLTKKEIKFSNDYKKVLTAIITTTQDPVYGY